jgi:CHAT domain-containing protein/tetratricopeptide (TPR) repeat protein
LQEISQTEQSTPQTAQALLALGNTYVVAGDYQRAIPLYRQGLMALQALTDSHDLEETKSETSVIPPLENSSVKATRLKSTAELYALIQHANGSLSRSDYHSAFEHYQQLVAMVEALRDRQTVQPESPEASIPPSTPIITPAATLPVSDEHSSEPLSSAQSADLTSKPLQPALVEVIVPEAIFRVDPQSGADGENPNTNEESEGDVVVQGDAEAPALGLSGSNQQPTFKNQLSVESAQDIAQIPSRSPMVLPRDELDLMTVEEAKGKIEFYRKILSDARNAKVRIEIANAALNLGRVYLNAGQFKDARKAFDEAIGAISDNDLAKKAIALIGRSQAYLGLQDTKQAVESIRQADAIIQSIGNLEIKADVQLKLADGYLVLGQVNKAFYDKSLEILKQAQQIFKARNKPNQEASDQEASAQLRLANLYYLQENYQSALTTYKKVQVIFEKRHDRPREISAWLNLGQVYLEDPECYENINCYEEARKAFDAVLRLLGKESPDEQTNQLISRARATLGLSDAYLALALQDPEKYIQAIAYAEQAKALFKKIDEQEKQLKNTNVDLFVSEIRRADTNISDAHLNQGQYNDAFNILDRSQTAVQQIDARLGNLPRIVKIIRGATTFARFVPVPVFQQIMFAVNSLAAMADDVITITRDSRYLMSQVNAFLSQKPLDEAIGNAKRKQGEAKASGNYPEETKAWIELGNLQLTIAKYSDATNSFKSALESAKLITDFPLQANLQAEAQLGLADSYYAEGKTGEAKVSAEQAQTLFHSQSNSIGEANALMTLGKIALGTGNFKAAQSFAQDAKNQFRKINQTMQSASSDDFNNPVITAPQDTRREQAKALLILSAAELNLGNLEAAQTAAIDARKLFQRLGDRIGEGNATLALANAYQGLGQYPKAMQASTRALSIFRNMGDRTGEANALTAVGNVLSVQKQNEQAIRSYKLSQNIEDTLLAQAQPDRGLLGLGGLFRWALRGLNQVFNFLPSSASDFVWKASGVVETVRGALDVAEGSGASVRIGDAYLNMDDRDNARKAFLSARDTAKKQGNPTKEASAWLGLSSMELNFFNNSQNALENAQKAFELYQQTNNTSGKAYALLAQGAAYLKLAQQATDPTARQSLIQKSLVVTQGALALLQSIEDKSGAAQAFRQLGDIYAPATPTENDINVRAAIAFYKESVNITEEIRQKGIRQRKYQVSYLSIVSETYRRLAELLLTTNNLYSAQRVLELLKVQELEDYGVRATVDKNGKITYSPLEEQIRKLHQNSLLNLGKELARCETETCSNLATLNTQLENLVKQEFSKPLEAIKDEIGKRQRDNPKLFADPTDLSINAANLINPCAEYDRQERSCSPIINPSQLRTALIYPLVREKKLWLLWAGPGKLAHRFEVNVDASTLRSKVFEFYRLLSDKDSNLEQLRVTANQLYRWLIRPLEEQLQTGKKINNLIFIQDQFIRYIPMSALVDDEGKYLIERFSISSVIRAEDTDVATRLPSTAQNFRVLAMGQAEGDAGQRPLEYVETELKDVVKLTGAERSKMVFGSGFTFSTLQESLKKSPFRVLHIATHGKFNPDLSDQSYLRLGDGNPLNVPKIRELKDLGNIHLVVLSACETGLGQDERKTVDQKTGIETKTGVEIPALSFSFMEGKRAKAVISSLWAVNDCSTAQLMREFYENAAKIQKFTKAEALQQAQLKMIRTSSKEGCANRSSVVITPPGGSNSSLVRDLRHPFYWSPFILIGNGF